MSPINKRPLSQDSSDQLDIGPLRLSQLRVQLKDFGISGQLKYQLWPPRVSFVSADLRGTIITSSLLEIPRLGLEGRGNYLVELVDIQVRNNVLHAHVRSTLDLNAGALKLRATVAAEGVTRLDSSGDPSKWWQDLTPSLKRASVDFEVSARLGLGPIHLLDITGKGRFSSTSAAISGDFHGGLPPLLYTQGRFRADLAEGIRLRGGAIGLLIPSLNDLGPGFKSLTGFTPPGSYHLLPHLSFPHASSFLEPGFLQFGLSLFDVNVTSGSATILSVGASPTSSVLPYFPDGNRMPFNGISAGFYVGGSLIMSFGSGPIL